MSDERIAQLEQENQNLKEQVNALSTILKAIGKTISEQEAISEQSGAQFGGTCPYCGTEDVFEDDDVGGLDRCNGCGKYWFKKER
jgi:DNA repair exonuclease SbcCD ATPase subunit